ncbi:MAG: hypothetical protein LQ340_007198 [Diploschistes diacapsis]|nr:MAG: hypothetical protein LQ340_007198 [Diploschistes diacapsis]
MSDTGNVIRGHKAAMNNPNVSDEAKQHSAQVVSELSGSSETTGQKQDTGKDPSRIVGGLKALVTAPFPSTLSLQKAIKLTGLRTISNPRVSDEAKLEAERKLEHLPESNTAAAGERDDGKDPEAVARGLKASITNPNVSDAAKKEAERKLKEMGA